MIALSLEDQEFVGEVRQFLQREFTPELRRLADAQTGVFAEPGGDAVARHIGPQATFVRHDVRYEDGWRHVVARTKAQSGRLYVLVNNAGVVEFEDIESFSLLSWRRIYEISVLGAVLGCKHAIPAIHRSGGHGSIDPHPIRQG